MQTQKKNASGRLSAEERAARGLGDVYKRQQKETACGRFSAEGEAASGEAAGYGFVKG